MGQEIVNIFVESYDREPGVIILDCDDTNNNTYGQQELNLYNHYYQDHCYMPLHIYEGLSGRLIATVLKPGRRSKQSDIASFLKKLILHLRQEWANTVIIVRGDSHFTSPDFMRWCEQQYNTGYISGLSGHRKLHEMAATTVKSTKREFEQYGKDVKRYHSFPYQAGTWPSPQKVVVEESINHHPNEGSKTCTATIRGEDFGKRKHGPLFVKLK